MESAKEGLAVGSEASTEKLGVCVAETDGWMDGQKTGRGFRVVAAEVPAQNCSICGLSAGSTGPDLHHPFPVPHEHGASKGLLSWISSPQPESGLHFCSLHTV